MLDGDELIVHFGFLLVGSDEDAVGVLRDVGFSALNFCVTRNDALCGKFKVTLVNLKFAEHIAHHIGCFAEQCQKQMPGLNRLMSIFARDNLRLRDYLLGFRCKIFYIHNSSIFFQLNTARYCNKLAEKKCRVGKVLYIR